MTPRPTKPKAWRETSRIVRGLHMQPGHSNMTQPVVWLVYEVTEIRGVEMRVRVENGKTLWPYEDGHVADLFACALPGYERLVRLCESADANAARELRAAGKKGRGT